MCKHIFINRNTVSGVFYGELDLTGESTSNYHERNRALVKIIQEINKGLKDMEISALYYESNNLSIVFNGQDLKEDSIKVFYEMLIFLGKCITINDGLFEIYWTDLQSRSLSGLHEIESVEWFYSINGYPILRVELPNKDTFLLSGPLNKKYTKDDRIDIYFILEVIPQGLYELKEIALELKNICLEAIKAQQDAQIKLLNKYYMIAYFEGYMDRYLVDELKKEHAILTRLVPQEAALFTSDYDTFCLEDKEMEKLAEKRIIEDRREVLVNADILFENASFCWIYFRYIYFSRNSLKGILLGKLSEQSSHIALVGYTMDIIIQKMNEKSFEIFGVDDVLKGIYLYGENLYAITFEISNVEDSINAFKEIMSLVFSYCSINDCPIQLSEKPSYKFSELDSIKSFEFMDLSQDFGYPKTISMFTIELSSGSVIRLEGINKAFPREHYHIHTDMHYIYPIIISGLKNFIENKLKIDKHNQIYFEGKFPFAKIEEENIINPKDIEEINEKKEKTLEIIKLSKEMYRYWINEKNNACNIA